MFVECKEYLILKLKASGLEKEPFTTLKSLKSSSAITLSAVLFEKEVLEVSNDKKTYIDNGTKGKRRKKYSREITFTVVIGDANQEKIESTYLKFINALDNGFYAEGNYIYIEPGEAAWVDKDDSIINAKCAVQLTIVFKGGVYKDTPFAKIENVSIDVQKED